MPRINSYDEIIINCSADDVWKVLTDFPAYNKWWPNLVKLNVIRYLNEIVGTEFQASPFGGKSFACKVISIIPNKEIKLNYFEGIYRGEGVWNIEKKGNLISVSYKVDLEIVDKFIVILSKIISVPKLHSWIFKKILKGLARQINASDQSK